MIPLLKPSYSVDELDNIVEVMRSGWWGHGPKCEEFERRIAERHGYRFAVTVNSATAALHLACIVAGVGPDDEVIVPALTFVSTALAPTYCGARPVFADVDPKTLCIDWIDVSKKWTPKTKAIIPVDYAGYPTQDDALWPKGVTIIQDAAHNVGGPAWGFLVCLSFHPVKNLATGDGGAILTDDFDWYERLKALRWCGIDKSTHERAQKRYGWDYDIAEIGYKYHWNDIQAAIGLAQLDRLDDLIHKRWEIANEYGRLLKGVVELPQAAPMHTWHLFPIRVPAETRDGLIDALLAEGISAGVHYKPLTYYPMWADQDTPPVTEREWRRLVSLPIYYDLELDQVRHIAQVVKQVVAVWA